MVKNSMDEMLERLGRNFAEFAGTLRDVERTEEGHFIVPPDVMVSLVGHVEELFGTVRRTQDSVKTALQNEHLSREREWNRLLLETDSGTEH
ncbi:hypothetical protein [Desulfovibrio psychrotolerans]|uniref:Uncharacterized protein n=1 Tax=Desulfovibrio psychrotolerans TaxID=415242 RepID=A0A7J0BU57_9BACT|nr:hypothetical protein [Desulfovibrio psychrotolerans]GFM36712.1 hypothetical protein DSM19430T_13960 [Desulfovibrio psychrotolerans]